MNILKDRIDWVSVLIPLERHTSLTPRLWFRSSSNGGHWPSEAAQCHQTDEFCYVNQIDEAFEIYTDLIRRMCE